MADPNGVMLGVEFQRANSAVRVRFVYPGGSVTHTMPAQLAEDYAKRHRSVDEFFSGKGRSVRVGSWAGPE